MTCVFRFSREVLLSTRRFYLLSADLQNCKGLKTEIKGCSSFLKMLQNILILWFRKTTNPKKFLMARMLNTFWQLLIEQNLFYCKLSHNITSLLLCKHDVVDLKYFKHLILLDRIILVWNIKGLRHIFFLIKMQMGKNEYSKLG